MGRSLVPQRARMGVALLAAFAFGGDNALAAGLEVPPLNVAPPVISGVPTVGQSLSCSQGLWLGPPTSYAYQWTRDDADVAGASGPAYTVSAADAGKALRCRVQASNSSGSASSTSLPLVALASPTSSPGTTPPPGSSKPALPPAADVIRLPSRRSCVSRRHFRIRIRRPKGIELSGVVVYVNGRPVKAVNGPRLTAPVDLRGLPAGNIKVRIEAATSDGRLLKHTRKYRTCSVKRGKNRRHRL